MSHKKSKKVFIIIVAFAMLVSVVCFAKNIPFSRLSEVYSTDYITLDELSTIQNKNYFGPFVKMHLKGDKTIDIITKECKYVYEPEIQFKILDLIPIKSHKLKVIGQDKLYVGGAAIGLVLKTDGVLVVGSSPISTPNGEYDALLNSDLKVGDTILKIEDQTVDGVSSISEIINKDENKNKELSVVLKRNNRELTTRLKPCYDVKGETYKLGVWVRDDATGVGTLTYVDGSNRFGALGHPICDSDTKSQIDLKSGKVYNCSILGYEKGVSGNPGELHGLFMQGKNEQGVVEKNNSYGIFGNLKEDNILVESCKEMEIGGRLSVKPGKAQIRCCLDGTKIETFDIEIIKTNYQSYSNDKSMVIRVVDDDLIARTGGIVQGMSGSPIIQNGKIVGAVTHVFINDPTKGFGVYLDWMLNQ